MFRWLTGRGASQAEVHEMQARIPEPLWRDVLAAHPFFDALDAADLEALRARAAWLLASKQINAAGCLELNDFMRLSICAQAALPILKLSPQLYAGWDEIIVYPSGFTIPQVMQDEDGVVHEYLEEAAGQAWDGGPVILSWDDAADAQEAFNVVIHEFAHKLDLRAGSADGMPDLGPGLSPRQWQQTLQDSLAHFRRALDEIEAAIPPDIDPESPDADTWYGQLPLDPYAATDEAEFFAVSSEHFFTAPWPLAEAMPDWYALLRAYYQQDPLARLS
ncbi:zinc-dependent peptidase [Bordetella avium]|uniref:M90 family metallopeptidase n=1 Tax=Bordetella avium TaxID=521 RepID=UPI0015F9F6E4|nr:M90 family metallopeptidase [Bordetella avium]